ncbi:hypothetical protein THAOC_04619 [Thalassiosira oceanica]|uniref:Hook C-terminal domain-containing protein n=1 Tax=Thalassiosira oceanica TaxID=159749 RepID=K0T9J6_THAOC|nr:hypothetical protein THAOC_04619 [Thalassiosira oceanica]|eukprot:EJK73739.1 hypothetical protein THAOC_04619 [Thalassiosira oceanica]
MSSDGRQSRRLEAIVAWLFDFPQLLRHRKNATVNLRLAHPEVLSAIVAVSAEICEQDEDNYDPPSSFGEATATVLAIMQRRELSVGGDDDFVSLSSALICHALSDKCGRQHEYVCRIKAMDLVVQKEIMDIIQESLRANCSSDNVEETGDYSAFLGPEASHDASVADSLDCDSMDDGCAAKEDQMEDVDDINEPPAKSDDPPRGKIADEKFTAPNHKNDTNLHATITKLEQDLRESRKQEMDLAQSLDECESNHRAEMLQMESKHMQSIRDTEDNLGAKISAQTVELESLRAKGIAVNQLKDENSRLQDELDVLRNSKEKLAFSEEQLRKCRDKIESIGDAHEALQREEKAHAAAVDKCVSLENDLAILKPLKRQLEEYRVRATNAEAALEESREDLRRMREKSSGLEGAHIQLREATTQHQMEANALSRRLQEGTGKLGDVGNALGKGMSELNPELLEEIKMLRSEYSRLKEFESKREVDAVQRLEETLDDTKRLADRYKEQFFHHKSELENAQGLFRESEAREARLTEELAELTGKYKKQGADMKEERLKAHKAALDAERAYQNEKKSLIEKSRQDAQILEAKMTQKLGDERQVHAEKMKRAELQRNEIENNFQLQMSNLREQASKTLRTAKELAQSQLNEMERSKEKLTEEKASEIEALMTKGKTMLKQYKAKNTELKRQITERFEVQLQEKSNELERLTELQQKYEKAATAKIAKRDKQIAVLESRNQEYLRVNDELEGRVHRAERSSKDLAGDNDRLRRQLGSRYGNSGASHNQLEELTSVCNSLREENKRLKAMNPDKLLFQTAGDGPGSNNSSPGGASGESFSKSTLTQLRHEYEERIAALEDERRDLVMRSSAASSETEKAEQRAWDMSEELAKAKEELTSLKLALQRTERQKSIGPTLSSTKKRRFGEATERENTPNVRILPPTGKQDFTPKVEEKRPSLVEMTRKSDDDVQGATPECQQS